MQDSVKVIIIDYLQLIHLSGGTKWNRVAEIEQITTNFKNMASELGISIIILSQLSRECQRREDKTPVLSDLRDSGSIEQDSNIVMFLHKLPIADVNYNDFEKSVKLIVAKNRSGKAGSFNLKYNGELTQFMELMN
jgi:replicative DNA helicase